MEEIKYKYNKVLKKYHKCCEYLEKHPEKTEKYVPKLIDYLDTLEGITKQISNPSAEEILNGFQEKSIWKT